MSMFLSTDGFVVWLESLGSPVDVIPKISLCGCRDNTTSNGVTPVDLLILGLYSYVQICTYVPQYFWCSEIYSLNLASIFRFSLLTCIFHYGWHVVVVRCFALIKAHISTKHFEMNWGPLSVSISYGAQYRHIQLSLNCNTTIVAFVVRIGISVVMFL